MNKLNQMITARTNGIVIPYYAMRAADSAGIPYPVLCAFLEQESSGGQNVFGHDPTIFVGAGKVTKKKYLQYKAERLRTGKMQGVGPMQLCVSPETKVLTADLVWERADKVTAGTEIIAFDESGVERRGLKSRRRYFRTTTVEAMKVEIMPRMRVITSTGEITVTPNHMFLTYHPARYRWKRADELTSADNIVSINMWDYDDTRDGGYITGQSAVLHVEGLEDGPMVAHQTGTRTIITNGLLSHNTWWEFQDRADDLGGCWNAYINTLVGAQLLRQYKDEGLDWIGVGERYNGRRSYGVEVNKKILKWQGLLA